MPDEDAVTLWQFQSKLMWSRIQTATVIEAGTLGGWYRLWNDNHSFLAVVILFLGACLLLVVSFLMHRDGQYMAACEACAGFRIPKPQPSLFWKKLLGRRIAVGVPIGLAICNLIPLVYTFAVRCC